MLIDCTLKGVGLKCDLGAGAAPLRGLSVRGVGLKQGGDLRPLHGAGAPSGMMGTAAVVVQALLGYCIMVSKVLFQQSKEG